MLLQAGAPSVLQRGRLAILDWVPVLMSRTTTLTVPVVHGSAIIASCWRSGLPIASSSSTESGAVKIARNVSPASTLT